MSKNTAQIKGKIPYGGVKEIAERAKTSIYTVSRVVNGKSENVKVLRAITQYLKDVKNTKKELTELTEA
jgi:hypothetical protein